MVRFINLMALPLAVFAAAVPPEGSALEARQGNDCQVDRVMGDTWVNAGMTRHRVKFSSTNTPASAYCDMWGPLQVVNNFQCWTFEDDTQGALDVSFARGPAGDSIFITQFRDSLDSWRRETHCQTG